jgi:hypothetical protein
MGDSIADAGGGQARIRLVVATMPGGRIRRRQAAFPCDCLGLRIETTGTGPAPVTVQRVRGAIYFSSGSMISRSFSR